MPSAALLPLFAPLSGADGVASVSETLEWALSGLNNLAGVEGETTLVVLIPRGPEREAFSRAASSNSALRIIEVPLEDAEGLTPEELGERAFAAAVSALSSLDGAETLIFLIPWGGLDPVTSSALLGSLAHSLTTGRRLTVVARRSGLPTSVESDEPPSSVLETARIAEVLSRVLEDPQHTSLWVKLIRAAENLQSGLPADLLREAALLSLGISLGSPLMVHLHLCRLHTLLEWAEGEGGALNVRKLPAEVIPQLVGEFTQRASGLLNLAHGCQVGELPSGLIGRLVSLYRRKGMALQYHLLLAEVAGTLDEAPPAGRGADPSTLASFLLERGAVECRVGRLPPGAPLFRLWFLAGGSLEFLRPGALGRNPDDELGAWLERLMASRQNSKLVRLLEDAISARFTLEHVRNFLAHSGFVHYVVRDVAPLVGGGYVVYYDEAAVEGVEGVMLASLLGEPRSAVAPALKTVTERP